MQPSFAQSILEGKNEIKDVILFQREMNNYFLLVNFEGGMELGYRYMPVDITLMLKLA